MAAGPPRAAAPSAPLDGELAFQCAVTLRGQGDSLRADALCSAVLQAEPAHYRAYHLRGLIALERGDTDLGIELIERSLAINPDQALAYSNIGNALLSAGQAERALGNFDQALRLQADLVIAHYNRGTALKALGRFEAALSSYGTVLALDSVHVKALNNRGLVLLELGRVTAAVSDFERASGLDPRFAAAQENLAAALLELHRPGEALAISQSLLKMAPEDPRAHCRQGNALLALDRLDEAVASFSNALRLDPGCADALINRAAALQRQLRLEEALVDSERALQLRPASILALNNAANVLLGLNRAAHALAHYERALALAPRDSDALHGQAAALLKLERFDEAAHAFAELLRIHPDHLSALGNLFHLRMEQCDWTDYAMLSSRVLEAMRGTGKFVNPLSLLMCDAPDVNLACARAFVAASYPECSLDRSAPPAARCDSSRIRVAYVSADFCDHPVAHLLVGALEHHDRDRFEVIGLSLRPGRGGPFEQRVHEAFDRCVDVSARSDRQVAELMRDWGVDVAVDLMGFTEGLRLGVFAHRAAPVQVGYLGYAGTVGAPYMDYLLADGRVIPQGHERWYSEQVVRLPYCYLPTDDRREIAAPPTRAHAGLPQQGFVFCAFTKPHKINPRMFQIWMRLLQRAEGSVLWLRDMGVAARANLALQAEALGVDRDRLIFAPRLASMAEHLGRQALADLYLDTWPYNAHSTTCDALWAGVPVLTCAGVGFASRVAASALEAVGLPELIAQSLEEYERCATDLARQPEQLQALRLRLARQRQRSPLFDTARHTRFLEAAYARMHELAQRHEAPAAFAISSAISP